MLGINSDGARLIQVFPDENFPGRSVQFADFDAVRFGVGPVDLATDPVARQPVRLRHPRYEDVGFPPLRRRHVYVLNLALKEVSSTVE